MSGTRESPAQQFVAAWRAAAAVAAEWAERTAAVTAEAFHKLTSDPAVRAVMEPGVPRFPGRRVTANARAPLRTPTTLGCVTSTR